MFVSRKLADVETRYSQIEREFLEIVFAVQRLRVFLLKKKFIKTDNKPLISFFQKPIHQLPVWIQRWLLVLQPFPFEMKHISACDNEYADTPTRNPMTSISHSATVEGDFLVCLITDAAPLGINYIKEEGETDSDILLLNKVLRCNWENKEAKQSPFFQILEYFMTVPPFSSLECFS